MLQPYLTWKADTVFCVPQEDELRAALLAGGAAARRRAVAELQRRFEQEEAARHAEVPSAYFRGSAPAARAPVDRPVHRAPAARAGLREHREQQPVAPAAFRGVPLCGAPVAPATFRGPLGPRPRGQEAQATVESAYLPPFDRFAGSEPCFAPLGAPCFAPLDAPAGAAEHEPESPRIRTPSPQWASLEAGGINLSFPMIGEASRPVALPAADAFSPLGAWVDAC